MERLLPWLSWLLLVGQYHAVAGFRNKLVVLPSHLASSRSPRSRSLRSRATPRCAADSFLAMKSLEERLTAVRNMGPETLGGFYDAELQSFAVAGQGSTSRFSVTSTCFALQAILSGPEGWKGKVFTGINPSLRTPEQVPLADVLRSLASAEWRVDDLFQVPIVIITLLRFDASGDLMATVDEAKLKGAIETILDSRSRRRYGRSQPNSAYTQFWLVRAMLGAWLAHRATDRLT